MGTNLEGVFDPTQFQPTMGGGQALPISDAKGHLVIIVESEMKATANGAGQMLALTCRIQDGPHAGQEGNWNLNLGNANATTVRIAQQELACICHAVGHLAPMNNTEVLHNKPFRLVVAAQKGEGADKGYTNVVKVLRADGSKLTDPAGGGGGFAPPAQPPGQPSFAPPANPAAAWPTQPVNPGPQPQPQPQMQMPPQQPQPQFQQPQQPQPQWQQPQPQPVMQPQPQMQPQPGNVPWGRPPGA